MTRGEIASYLAENTGISRKAAAAVLVELSALARQEARRGFTLPGIGTIAVRERKARTGRDPATGKSLEIPAERTLVFRFVREAKEAILG